MQSSTLDLLRVAGAKRGIDTSHMHDETLATLIHAEADRLGIPADFSGFRYKARVAARLALSGTKDVVEAMLDTSEQDSILPLVVVKVIGGPRPSCLKSENYYGFLDEDERKDQVYRRTGSLVAGSDFLSTLAALDGACVPDTDVMDDAKGDGVDIAAFSSRLLDGESMDALSILNQTGPLVYRAHEYAPRAVVYRPGKTLEEYEQELKSPQLVEWRGEMQRQSEDFEEALRVDAMRRREAEAQAEALVATLRSHQQTTPTTGEKKLIESAREYKILDSLRAGANLTVRFRLFDGRAFTAKLRGEDLMETLEQDIAAMYELETPLLFSGRTLSRGTTVSSFGLNDRSSVNVE